MRMEFMEFTPEEEAAACEHFNKGLYPKCRGKNDPNTCFACFFLKARRYHSDTRICFFCSSVILLIACFALGGSGLPRPAFLAACIAASGIPFGWKALRRVTPQKFQSLPGAGRAVCFLLKVLLSALTGWAAAAVRVYRTARILRLFHKVRTIAAIK